MNYIYTLKSYKCNKKCPYCITKILRRREKEDWKQLPEMLAKLKAEGKVFSEFVLSGNGETSNYPIQVLAFIKTAAEESGMFTGFRIQTSGKLFFERSKLLLFKDWYKEITIVSTNPTEDMAILKYKRDYMTLAAKTPRTRCNIVLTKNQRWKQMVFDMIKVHDTVALKILDGENKWINENAIPWSQSNQIVGKMNDSFGGFVYDSVSRRYWWYYKDKPITMSFGKELSPDYIQIEVK